MTTFVGASPALSIQRSSWPRWRPATDASWCTVRNACGARYRRATACDHLRGGVDDLEPGEDHLEQALTEHTRRDLIEQRAKSLARVVEAAEDHLMHARADQGQCGAQTVARVGRVEDRGDGAELGEQGEQRGGLAPRRIRSAPARPAADR